MASLQHHWKFYTVGSDGWWGCTGIRSQSNNSGPCYADMRVKIVTITLALVTMASIYWVYAVPPDNVFCMLNTHVRIPLTFPILLSFPLEAVALSFYRQEIEGVVSIKLLAFNKHQQSATNGTSQVGGRQHSLRGLPLRWQQLWSKQASSVTKYIFLNAFCYAFEILRKSLSILSTVVDTYISIISIS